MIIVVEEQLLTKTLGWLKAKQIIANGIAAIAQIILNLIGTRIKIAIRIGIQEKFIHFLAIALATAAAAAHLAGQVAPGRHNWQEGIGRRRMGRRSR